MVIRNLENKIKLVGIICSFFLVGCIIISVSSIWTARTMVTDAQKKVYVLDGNVPILVNRTTMDETLDVEAKSMWKCSTTSFSRFLPMTSTSNTRWKRRCTWWTRPDLHSTTRSKRKAFTPTSWERVPYSPFTATVYGLTKAIWSSLITDGSVSSAEATS